MQFRETPQFCDYLTILFNMPYIVRKVVRVIQSIKCIQFIYFNYIFD